MFVFNVPKISSSMPKESVVRFNLNVKSSTKRKEFVNNAIKVIHFIMVLAKLLPLKIK